MTYLDAVVKALNNLGGQAKLKDIYAEVDSFASWPNNYDPHASIRKTLQIYSSDSKSYQGGLDIFYMVGEKGDGIWGLRDPDINTTNMDITQDDASFAEGKKNLKTHIVRERNHALIEEAKKNFKATHGGKLYCEVCGFNFTDHYGSLGDGFIEAHHIKPVSKMKPGERTKVSDLIMVCSNCHSMIHRRKPWLTKPELKKIYK